MRHLRIVLLLIACSAAQAGGVPGDRFTHFAGFDLGKGTLSDVQKQLGASRVRESGDAGEYEAWICYSTPHGEVQFNSGEMGGGTELLGFTISRSKSAADCPAANRRLPLGVAGLKLGITRKEFRTLTGTRVKWAKNVGTAEFEYQTGTTRELPIDVYISVLGTFSHNKLVKLVVWKIETT